MKANDKLRQHGSQASNNIQAALNNAVQWLQAAAVTVRTRTCRPVLVGTLFELGKHR
jgi:hypothetical protein